MLNFIMYNKWLWENWVRNDYDNHNLGTHAEYEECFY